MTSSNYAEEFVRKLTQPLAKSLEKLFKDHQSWLYRWFEATDKQMPFLAIRKDYANVYVKGCAFKLSARDAALSFNANYLRPSRCNRLRDELRDYLKGPHDRKFYAVPSCVMDDRLRIEIVEAALEYIDPKSLESKASTDKERPRVTEALVQYGLSLDCEIAFTERMVTHAAERIQQRGESIPDWLGPKAGKNQWSIKKPDALLLQRIGDRCVLRFFEAKDGGNDKEWKGERPAVLDQVWFYDRLICEYKDRLVEQYRDVLRLYGRLGIYHPRFQQYTEFMEGPQLNSLELDPHHDIVLLGDRVALSADDKRVLQLSEKLRCIPGGPERKRLHLSLNAADWVC